MYLIPRNQEQRLKFAHNRYEYTTDNAYLSQVLQTIVLLVNSITELW